jgi:hypothetical protein
MNASSRFMVCVVVLTCSAAVAAAVQPRLLAVVGLEVKSGDLQMYGKSATYELIEQRIKAKTQVVKRLQAGEATLFEAAAVFRTLNEEPPEARDLYWRTLPGADDGEKLCRQVINWTRVYLEGTATTSQVVARMQELEEELQLHIACNAGVVLPEDRDEG